MRARRWRPNRRSPDMSTAPRVLLTHAIVWSAIGAWLVGGSEVAGNIVLFVLWTLAVTGIAVVFVIG